ncbi:RNA polymerase sigma factor, sigma-70 family [Catalinimonas alkaloidigena]|uniref:RNA polymerase sigma factor, sigma-70 family n=1 Tax=Catalinimonas alkaloidigena TaxID=1075417 RepID=A0A1G9KIB9_9BACT|nr:sigma-70 family RNA polymerase sigma factor [Catalinimonas alkaloidigena]SDL49336.1 RNA polymerase sigma factor, sigma-70 family [Catalinimonas alkaloidigena]
MFQDPPSLHRIVDELRAGNRLALEELYLHYYQRLCDFACQITHNPELAEEVVVKVFMNLWQHRQLLSISSSLQGYLYATVRRKAQEATSHQLIPGLQKKKAENADEAPFNPLDLLLYQELNYRPNHLVDRLPAQDQLILRLKLSGLSYTEIALTLALSWRHIAASLDRSLNFFMYGGSVPYGEADGAKRWNEAEVDSWLTYILDQASEEVTSQVAQWLLQSADYTRLEKELRECIQDITLDRAVYDVLGRGLQKLDDKMDAAEAWHFWEKRPTRTFRFHKKRSAHIALLLMTFLVGLTLGLIAYRTYQQPQAKKVSVETLQKGQTLIRNVIHLGDGS